MTDESERKPWVGWRDAMVCDECWVARAGDREPCRLRSAPNADSFAEGECMVCEEPTASGIFVRMRVEWR